MDHIITYLLRSLISMYNYVFTNQPTHTLICSNFKPSKNYHQKIEDHQNTTKYRKIQAHKTYRQGTKTQGITMKQ